MNETYSNAIVARCKGQGADERVGSKNWPTAIFAKHNKKAAVALSLSLLQEQFARRSQFLAFDRVDLRIG